MNEVIKKDILQVLNDLIQTLKAKGEKDTSDIKQLSNKVIHNASIFQDEDSVSVAILIYSISKIIERARGSIDYSLFSVPLNKAVKFLQGNDEEGFRSEIKEMFSSISSMDSKLKIYIQEVINQSQIRKGCKLCAHGISVERASKVLGISQWELLDYLGETAMLERFEEPVSVKIRLANARKLFV